MPRTAAGSVSRENQSMAGHPSARSNFRNGSGVANGDRTGRGTDSTSMQRSQRGCGTLDVARDGGRYCALLVDCSTRACHISIDVADRRQNDQPRRHQWRESARSIGPRRDKRIVFNILPTTSTAPDETDSASLVLRLCCSIEVATAIVIAIQTGTASICGIRLISCEQGSKKKRDACKPTVLHEHFRGRGGR